MLNWFLSMPLLQQIALLYSIPVLVTLVALYIDDSREHSSNDDFTGNNLFYKYGQLVSETSITIGVDNQQKNNMIDIVERLTKYLITEMQQQFAGMGPRFECTLKLIKDRKLPSDERRFIQTTIKTKRRSEIHYFILVLGVGHQLVIHEYMYLRGQRKWFSTIMFILFSPLSIISWFIPWLKQNFSLNNHLKNAYNKSTFDSIDIITVLRGLKFLFSTRLKTFAQKENLLTQELNTIITQVITNSQNINISNSNKVNVSNIKALNNAT